MVACKFLKRADGATGDLLDRIEHTFQMPGRGAAYNSFIASASISVIPMAVIACLAWSGEVRT
jgi:hypothetical protein|tara:strand:+ start:603 stop:791 length:189 start_codon:yes stop_codon:yes gene_type:complete